jgi:low temperature requirement protein LtrA
MEAASSTRRRRIDPGHRQGERVSPLELFFDLVFVLAITQCTQLMADNPTWEGLGQGVLVLGLLWWAWAGYSWLTSVLDPDADAVRAVIFASMGALLIASICIPDAFGDLGLEVALAYGFVRYAHIGLFIIASRDDPDLRRSVLGLVVGCTICIGLMVGGSFLGPGGQALLWGTALALDVLETVFFGAGGWKLQPAHFAERYSLIVLIALGESIVAIGVGAEVTLTTGIALAAAGGIALIAAMWWVYFDVVSVVSARRLVRAEVGRVQNTLARDSYSYMHFVMVAGIVLVALGLKKTIGDVDHPLKTETAFALLGGVALYLLGLVMFRYRHVHTINWQRLGLAAILLASLPLATQVDAVYVVGAVALVMWLMIGFETRTYGEGRARIRAEFARGDELKPEPKPG